MGVLYYSKVGIVSATATDAASGYPASNVALESIGRPWRSLDTGAKDVTVTFSAATAVQALLLQDVNFGSCVVNKSPDGTTFSLVGTLTTYADKLTNRSRGLIVVNDPGVKALKISISAGTPLDALAYWRIGAIYVFASTSALPRMPDFGMKTRALYPKVAQTLANGLIAQASVGADILELSMPYWRHYDQDVIEMLRRARVGTVGLSLVPTNYNELVLPVKHVMPQLEESFGFLDLTSLQIDLRESV